MKRSSFAGARGASVLLCLGIFITASPAFAHVTLQNAEAVLGSPYKAVLKVPHGCDGQPTVKLRVRIPGGVVTVKPMPKDGWMLESTESAYARSYDVSGEPITRGVTEIVWSGSLPDKEYAEFTFEARLTDGFKPGERIAFPVIQECPGKQEAWTDVAPADQDPHNLKNPAPSITILAAPVKAGDLVIEAPWARATPKGAQVGGGYVRITNTGREADRLIGGSVPLADRVEVHEMSMSDNVMHMGPVAGGLEIPPGSTVELKPDGFHLMFQNLKETLKAGSNVKGTLVFQKAGAVDVDYAVRAMSDSGASDHQHH